MPALIEPHDEFMGAVQQVSKSVEIVMSSKWETHLKPTDHSVFVRGRLH